MLKVAVPVASILNSQTKNYVSGSLSGPLGTLLKDLDVNRTTLIINSSGRISDIKLGENDILIIPLLTGGTERIALDVARKSKKAPVMLITSNEYNSFPAGLETLPAMRKEGHYTKLIYTQNWKKIPKTEVEQFEQISRAILRLRNLRIGLVGGPSSWLISSIVTPKVNKRINLKVVKISLQEIFNRYNQLKDANVSRDIAQITTNAREIKEVRENDLSSAYRIHLAVKNLLKDLGLDYVSVRCFDLIKGKGTTLCLSCFITNNFDKKIIGCEGDIPSLLTMIAMSSLSETTAWMANPIRIDPDKNTMTLAHCTVSSRIIKEYDVRSHFESSQGVGIGGVFKKNVKVTLSRIGGDLNKAVILSGRIIDSDFEDDKICRTKAIIKLDQKVSNYIDNAIGNHLIMIHGNYSRQLCELYDFLRLSIVCC